MEQDRSDKGGRRVRIWLSPPPMMAGPMGTAFISRVPTYRIQRDDWDKSVFCAVSRLARQLAACGMSEGAVAEALARAQALEDPGEVLELEVV